MKKAIILVLLLITVALQAQEKYYVPEKDDGVILTDYFHITRASCTKNNVSTDQTKLFTAKDGYIQLLNLKDNKTIVGINDGDGKRPFVGCMDTHSNLLLKDTMQYVTHQMSRNGVAVQARLTKIFLEEKSESGANAAYLFQLVFEDETWEFETLFYYSE